MGEETAESLTTFITERNKEEVEAATKEIATKDFVAKEIAGLETKMERALKEQTSWMIGIFITLALMIIGLYFKK